MNRIRFPVWLFFLRCILRFKGIRLVIANPRTARYEWLARQFCVLRDQIFGVKHRWEKVTGEERDEFDPASIYLLAVNGKEAVVAGCRVIHRRWLERLPIEKLLAAGVRVERDSVEISRVLNPTGDQTVFLALNLFVYVYARRNRFSGVYGTIRACYLKKLIATFGESLFERLPGEVFEKRQGDHAIRFLPFRIVI